MMTAVHVAPQQFWLAGVFRVAVKVLFQDASCKGDGRVRIWTKIYAVLWEGGAASGVVMLAQRSLTCGMLARLGLTW